MNRLQKKYEKEIKAALMKDFNYDNINQVPRLVKIIVNMGVGEATENKAFLDNAVKDLTQITGRKPVVTKAKKSISNFNIREGMPLGCKVTLRKTQMYEFLDKLINIALPKTRDFNGVSRKSFDGRGNYTLGIAQHTIFPEIEYDDVYSLQGLSITIVIDAETDEEGMKLLEYFKFPFKKVS